VADFLVNEVDMDGHVVHLTSKHIPDEMKMEAKALSEQEKQENEQQGLKLIVEEQLIAEGPKTEEFEAFLKRHSESEAHLLSLLSGGGESGGKNQTTVSVGDIPSLVLDAETDKNKRTRMHEVIRTHFGHVLISDTTPSEKQGGGTCVRLRYHFTNDRLKNLLLNNVSNSRDAKKNKKKGRKGKSRGGDRDGGAGAAVSGGSLFDPRCVAWPRDRPSFLQFVLYKENYDTTNAMSTIAKHIRVKPNLFTWAGTKDKRGVTAQLVTAFKVTPEKVSIMNSIPHSGIQVGNFKFVNHRLLLGQLRGNRFNLAIRKVVQQDDQVDDASITKAVETIQQTGFINYFGMQRFGMTDNPTHLLGQYVLKNDWEQVVTRLLRSRCSRNYRLKEVIDQFYVDKDANAALQKLSFTNSAIEKALLTGYAKSTVTDHSSAFGKLPRNLKTMFIHAYQSNVWNHMVSERVRKYGYKPIVGDLVLMDASDADFAEDDQPNMEDAIVEEEQPADAAASSSDATTASAEDESSLAPKKRGEPKVLTEEDLPNYTIFDVVMTVPGGSVIYPQHEFGEDAYFNFMKQDGIEKYHFTRYQEENGSYGAYRHMVAKAQDVTWKIVHHDNFDQKLLVTDAEKLKNFKLDEESTTGKFTSLVIGFTLPSSTYATMFMRELMKLPSVRDGEESQY